MLKIWGRANSINVQKVMWTVAELNLEAERLDAGMHHGVVTEPWFATVNPNRLVPAIDDDGFVLWESNAIVRYLAAKHATGSLMPAEPTERATADMWMDWQQTSIMPGLGPVFLGLVRTPAEERDLAAIDAGARLVETGMRILDGHLADRNFMLDDHLTVADIALGCAVYRWYALEIVRADLPNLRAWCDRLIDRPGFAEHVMLPLT